MKSRAVPAPGSPFLAWCIKHKLLCFGIVAAVWVYLLYHQALDAPFVYDDLDQIVNNPSLHSWAAVSARFLRAPVAFTSGFLGGGGSTYRPVFWLSIALDWRLWGPARPGGFHLTNVLIHWFNGLLLFQLLRKLELKTIAARIAALVWLGLPINTEVVAWISARAYLLSTFFILLALLSACGFVERKRWLALVMLSIGVIGAVFSHEQGLLLLPFLLVVLYAKARHDLQVCAFLTAIVLIVDGLYFIVKHAVGAHAGAGTSSPWIVGQEFWKYVQLVVLPVRMSLERSTSVPSDGPSLPNLAAWIGLPLLVGFTVLLRKRNPLASFALLSGCVALIPYCGIVYIYQGMAERFVYLAAIGFAVAIVSGIFAMPVISRKAFFVVGLLWVVWGAWRVTDRVRDWTDPVALYRSSLEATPDSPYLNYNLGLSLRNSGDQDGALQAYKQALQLKPDYPEALTSIGDIYAKQGKTAGAIEQYRQSLAFNPSDGKTIINYGVALQQIGDKAGAEQQFKRAIVLAPHDSAAYVDLGGLYNEEDRTGEAIQSLKKAIAVDPTDPDAYFDLAVMFQERGLDDIAMAFYNKVLSIKPGDPDTLLYMSKLHVGQGETQRRP